MSLVFDAVPQGYIQCWSAVNQYNWYPYIETRYIVIGPGDN